MGSEGFLGPKGIFWGSMKDAGIFLGREKIQGFFLFFGGVLYLSSDQINNNTDKYLILK